MSSSATSPPIIVTERGCALVIAIDRQQAGNSVSLETAEAIGAALAAARDRPELRGAVITGAGDKFFCTGGDVKAFRTIANAAELHLVFGAVRALLRAIEDHPLPVLAAINGYALGGGAELALACDLRFAAPNAEIGFPQARLGIIPGWNGIERLVRLVGRPRATRLLLQAARLSAAAALDAGLVDVVADAPLSAALAFLDSLDGAPLALRGIKQAIRTTDQPDPTATIEQIFEKLWFTSDHREAEAAFVEKRKPVFKGH